MTVQDDYPAITILADACAHLTDDGCPEAVRAWREVARLRQWKEEATVVIAEWDDVHYECAGASAHLGRTKAENVRRELRRLRGQCEVWMNGVADIVEPWGYDRRAASGPGDLLPGLTSLAERLRECVEARRYLYEQVVEVTEKPPSPGLRDGIRERPSTWPTDSGDPVENRNRPAAPPEVGDDPAGSDGSTATHGPAVGTGESPVTAHHRVIPQAGSNLCVCGEWFDAEVHQFPERVWKVRQRGRGDYDLLVDDQPAVLVSLQHGVVRPSLLVRRIAAAVAEHHGDRLEGAPGVDWQALGWQDQTEHDGLVDEISRIVQSWSGHRHEMALLRYVNTEKAQQGIPQRPPYSLAEADQIDKIVRRAPAVVEQDIAAEGSAA